MCNRTQPRSSFSLQTLRTWSIIIFVIILAVVCLIVPFRRTNALDGQSFTPDADTFIDGNEPNKNYGDDRSILVKTSPPMAGLLRFAVSGSPQHTPVGAQLRIFVTEGSNGAAATVYAFRTSAEWDEERMTWNSQPAFGDQLGASDVEPLVEGQWVEINLGPVISGDGMYSFAITSDTPDQISFAARTEANPAQLIIGIQENTPVPTQTPTPTDATTTPTDGTPTPTDATITPTDGTTTPTDATTTPTDGTTTPTESTTTPTPTDATPTTTPTEEMALSNNQNLNQQPTTTVNPSPSSSALPAKPIADYTIYLPIVRREDSSPE